jgi:uncharacterized membrane protein
MTERNEAMLNGALIALGTVAILDNVVVHWLLRLHRAVPGPHALAVEWSVIALGAVLLAVGAWREWRARERRPAQKPVRL